MVKYEVTTDCLTEQIAHYLTVQYQINDWQANRLAYRYLKRHVIPLNGLNKTVLTTHLVKQFGLGGPFQELPGAFIQPRNTPSVFYTVWTSIKLFN